ncbi:hypothetical protein [Gracilimonas sp.]|uniref:hypothetical protein n=1 Tax=Gracilimonas sp. TaxID=1974203 RepID=UPI0028714900|nr:hypothetical protein [Gracilimonas sp.]
MAKLEIPKGKRYGKLTVIKEVEKFVQPSGQTQRGFLCRCDCGNTKKVRLSHLEHDRVNSCGCLAGEFHDDHGTSLHNTWRGMKNRSKEYHSQSYLYSDRGIDICDEWENSYLEFKTWALENGYEEGLTIDRKNNDKGYHPGNCRFVPQYVNNANRRNTYFVKYKGEEIAFTLLLRKKGLTDHYAAIRSRIKRGWDVDEAIDTPIREGNYR